MSTILERWARFVVRRRKPLLGICFLVAVVAGLLFSSLTDRLKLELFVDKQSDAYKAQQLLKDEFGVGVPNLMLLVTARGGDVDDRGVVAEASALTEHLAAENQIADVLSYWTAGRPEELRSTAGDAAIIVARIEGDDQAVQDRVEQLDEELDGTGEHIEVAVGGSAQSLWEISKLSLGDFAKAERLVLPIILIALVLVFRSAVAALLSILVAVGSVLGTVLVLRGLVEVTEVSTLALTMVGTLALGLGVDYSLFVISRFREELARGASTEDAVVRSMQTAGRTVIFGAASVLISISALMLLPLNFLRSIGYSTAATAAMACAGALVLLPALLAVVGPNIDKFGFGRRRREPASGTGIWYRIARRVMRRRFLVGSAGLALLLLVSAPALHFRPGLIDDRDLPRGSSAREIGEVLRTKFDTRASTPMPVVLPGTDAGADAAAIDSFAANLAALPHVSQVATTTGVYSPSGHVPLPQEVAKTFVSDRSTYLNVFSDLEPLADESKDLLREIRRIPNGFDRVLIGGDAANGHDITDKIAGAFPIALLFILFATAISLFLQFGSLLVPLKALLLNILSLTSLIGALVWVFQDGHLSGFLDFTPTGSLYINAPVFIFCIGFGLSMDYELFLMSRIKEEYDRTGDAREAIALGLERSGRIVSAAAVLIALVFLATGLTTTLKVGLSFGYGMAFLILIDAFIIRCTLAPALMSMAGNANWWAPKPLRRLHARFGISEHAPPTVPAPSEGT